MIEKLGAQSVGRRHGKYVMFMGERLKDDYC